MTSVELELPKNPLETRNKFVKYVRAACDKLNQKSPDYEAAKGCLDVMQRALCSQESGDDDWLAETLRLRLSVIINDVEAHNNWNRTSISDSDEFSTTTLVMASKGFLDEMYRGRWDWASCDKNWASMTIVSLWLAAVEEIDAHDNGDRESISKSMAYFTSALRMGPKRFVWVYTRPEIQEHWEWVSETANAGLARLNGLGKSLSEKQERENLDEVPVGEQNESQMQESLWLFASR